MRIGQWFVSDLSEIREVPGTIEIAASVDTTEATVISALSGYEAERGRLYKFSSDEGDGYQCEIVTGELRMAGINGMWQGREIYILGEKLGDSDVTVALSYNGKDFSRYIKTYDMQP